MADLLNILNSLLINVGQWLHSYLYHLSMLIMVCLVSLYAGDIIKLTKGLVARRHFIVRVLCFVLITAFGFGFVVVWLSPLLIKALLFFGTKWLGVTLLAAFFILGTIADRKNQL
ncbi:hypothetical protein PNIG_a1313 [Pseudoalteromonas nigrifaciens]|uniref:DUF3392 domain-containing protein n=1 Tax=Pseudoalteromonas nigrifaciens TaxID=28109 RepID=A0AAC9XWL2_9GAMM|nr:MULTISPECIES: DUF3392 family protein [Pseudoalteromonas]ASM53491.1 hypothetical protein PNIG_a1313 [Pseudoalteromonas nigrifaciens]MBB1369860.1 DUF3392 domain-containing protein [Pseudoalteromonas sp. SR45-4]MBB1404105.1 DUF3392 domain-containing protein [Pseudoalteromonas sp. SG44-5]SUC52654.1 Protein of uncharacterised function (DUF3392) [Pseudoalteromonas nigrifaciens]GEN43391.1 hypothetical protein PNI02_28570 [Pseudoalteromonas nigrifaciens]|tara:strand:+ start:81 stop:425 length:345 start_codon:yes stop_codon:yes gene_type:complete